MKRSLPEGDEGRGRPERNGMKRSGASPKGSAEPSRRERGTIRVNSPQLTVDGYLEGKAPIDDGRLEFSPWSTSHETTVCHCEERPKGAMKQSKKCYQGIISARRLRQRPRNGQSNLKEHQETSCYTLLLVQIDPRLRGDDKRESGYDRKIVSMNKS